MHDLKPQTALGAATPVNITIGSVKIKENNGLALASVTARRGQEESCRAALADWLGLEAPSPGRAVITDARAAVWMAQDQWLLSALFDDFEEIVQELKPVFRQSASITEQTAAWVCFDISGIAVVDMFERLCPMNVRQAQAGDATRTTIHHMGCFAICIETSAHLRVLGPRSSAESLHHALVTAARAIA